MLSCSDTKKDGTATGSESTEKAEPVEHPTVDTPLEQVEVKVPEGNLDEKSHKQLLDTYEEFIEGYYVLMEKAAKGDTAAYTKMMDVSKHVQSFGEQINKRRGQLSKEEHDRYLKLTQKLTKAMFDLQYSPKRKTLGRNIIRGPKDYKRVMKEREEQAKKAGKAKPDASKDGE